MKLRFTIRALVVGVALAGRSAPVRADRGAPKPEAKPAVAAKSARAELLQGFGLPQYLLDRCAEGASLSCKILEGLLGSLDRTKLPDAFSADLRLDDMAQKAYTAACAKSDPFGCLQAGLNLVSKNANRDDPEFQRIESVNRQACDDRQWTGCLFLALATQLRKPTPEGVRAAEGLLKRSCEFGLDLACRHPDAKGFNRAFELPEEKLRFERAMVDWDCRRGTASSCTLLGWVAFDGIGAAKAPDQANPLLGKACDLKDGMGCQLLALTYRQGMGVAKDPGEATRLMEKACDLGMGFSCQVLAMERWGDSQGVPADPAPAIKLFTRACDGGNNLSCAILGRIYLRGIGTAADPARGRALMEKGCRLKSALACQVLEAENNKAP